jgi:hypothetical protein
MRLGAAILAALALAGCRSTYPAPAERTVPRVSPTRWGRTASGDTETIRAAERQCLAGLSPRAVSAAFRAVDEVADALSELCSIDIVGDDPLVWHVWCGSDATFRSGHYLAPSDGAVACDGAEADTAFECIGRILARHLLGSGMSEHVEGVEIVSLGSVDRQRVAEESEFVAGPCEDLQEQLRLPEEARWSAPEEPPDAEARASLWNRRLSWCRAAFSARELREGMASRIGGQYELAAIGAGTDWLDHWRATHRTPCPTSPRVSGERGRGQCRDARRVDLFVRVKAEQGSEAVEACEPPSDLAGGESGRALYCYADCQARAAIGRNPQGFSAPRAPEDLLFGESSRRAPEGWIGARSAGGAPVNTASVRQLLLRE